MITNKIRHCLRMTLASALMMWGLFGCGKSDFDRVAWTERGAEVVKPFKMELMGALMEGLQDGPEAAIEVCQVVAPEIADYVSSAGIELGRTSHKLRNQDNAPREWTKSLLADYVATPTSTEAKVVQLEDGGVGYVEPIFVKRTCLACHGSTLSAGVASRIDRHYPQDQARTFEEGDFRGLFWVEFSQAEVESN